MVTAISREQNYQVFFTTGIHSGVADTTKDKGGGDSGMRPHDLLEAALASCLTMWVKMYAENHDISVSGVETEVVLDRSQPDEVFFEYVLNISGDLSEDTKKELFMAAKSCPVHKTLSRKITVRPKQ